MLSLLFLVAMVAVMWLLLIRPQQRRVRQHQELVQSLAPGDQVVTVGGIVGTIRRIEGDDLALEVAPGVVLQVLRAAVSRKLVDPLDQIDGLGDDDGPYELPGDGGNGR